MEQYVYLVMRGNTVVVAFLRKWEAERYVARDEYGYHLVIRRAKLGVPTGWEGW